MMRDMHDIAGAGDMSGAMEASEVDPSGVVEVDMDDCGSLALPPDLPPYSGDYIISDYMERLGTRLNILETELKYAWRALDLLSQEYVRMWERLERLEALLADQQGSVKKNASIDDLVCEEASRPSSQLDMIWEAPEEHEIEMLPNGSRQIYSALDYKDYRGLQGTSCISDRDIEQLSTLSAIDQMERVDKLRELDRFTAQLNKDSRELKDLKNRLLVPENKITTVHDRDIEAKTLAEDGNIINEQLKNVYNGSESWGINEVMKSFDDFMLSAPKESSQTKAEKSPSRLSLSDVAVVDRTVDYFPSNISPRRKFVPERTTTEPYTTVTGRLAYSSAVANAEINAAKASRSPSAISRDRFEYNSYQISDPRLNYYPDKSLTQPLNDLYKTSAEVHSPSLAIHDVMYNENTEKRLDLNYEEARVHKSPSPPPPAPPNGINLFASQNSNEVLPAQKSMLTTGDSMPNDNMRLSPRSPRSPKTSPKHIKRESANIVTAKSDSGLSSMSGWSSVEKSPGSPKTGKVIHGAHESLKVRMSSPQMIQKISYEMDHKPYLETLVDSYMYDSTNTKTIKSDYNLRKQEQAVKDSISRDINKIQMKHESSFIKSEVLFPVSDVVSQGNISDYYYSNEPPSIYSVAGNRESEFTTVYSSPKGIHSDSRSFSTILDRNELQDASHQLLDPYPPEPSYHAQTVVMPSSASKRSLSRANTMGGSTADNYYHQNGYKTQSHRITCPPGSLTDALTYYPTSSRYESPKKIILDDQISWQASSRSPTSSLETSSLKSHSLNISERKQFQNQLQQEYYRQQQYDQRNGNVMYDHHKAVEHSKIKKDQRHDSGGILVSEAGYLSIPSNAKNKQQDKQNKKPKRTSSLKSAMSSMSHWLPDLHLPKKHRSHSLPSGVDTVEQQQNEKSLKERLLSAQRRKKKYHLVASMSGLLQKARRKHQSSHHQSLSDPETSETEWSGGRSSAQSEDSDSVFSDSVHDNNVFSKIPKNRQRKINDQDIIEQQQKIQELQEHGLDFSVEEDTISIKEDHETIATNNTMPRDKSDDIDFHFARVSKTIKKDNISDLEKLDIDTDISNVDLYEDEKVDEEDNQSPASLFATVGDVKRAAVQPAEETINDSKYGARAPMEFAVSRALGKYRLRKSTSISDEQIADTSPPKLEPTIGIQEELNGVFITQKELKPRKPETVNSSITEHSTPPMLTERSPSTQSARSVQNKFMPRHQQSLEIPSGKHDDDDSRSTHSWRSGSRVSSRRQSTEDSIDSEDEWYCYELRKLEEMEHQSQIEAERQQTLEEEPEEEIAYEPNENLKEKMSYVLRELKLKTANTKKSYDESPVKDQTWKDITTFPVIDEVADQTSLEQKTENEEDDKSEIDLSSGETSGPDSPVMSGDELDEEYQQPIEPQETTLVEPSPQQDTTAVGSKWKLLKALKDRKAEEKTTTETPTATTPSNEKDKVSAGNGTGGFNDQSGRGNGHPGDNPFYSNIDSMPDIRPRPKSIPLVSELVS
ncbi:hypothetical protein EVAR_66320_1 [Eumeta japonica]|uniref:Uncharacterized protein n=1 Tax=Eumeta variegata TaxID=151549 RepID=A0A4C1ZWW0_EUMVA|nr:hypothetical protein EVAR_66320_1 [Eumeta japonica]